MILYSVQHILDEAAPHKRFMVLGGRKLDQIRVTQSLNEEMGVFAQQEGVKLFANLPAEDKFFGLYLISGNPALSEEVIAELEERFPLGYRTVDLKTLSPTLQSQMLNSLLAETLFAIVESLPPEAEVRRMLAYLKQGKFSDKEYLYNYLEDKGGSLQVTFTGEVTEDAIKWVEGAYPSPIATNRPEVFEGREVYLISSSANRPEVVISGNSVNVPISSHNGLVADLVGRDDLEVGDFPLNYLNDRGMYQNTNKSAVATMALHTPHVSTTIDPDLISDYMQQFGE